MNIDDTEKYEDLLLSIIDNISDEPVQLLFVDDINKWCSAREGENNGNPIAKAIRDSSSKEAGILLRKKINHDRYQGVIERIKIGNNNSEINKLNSIENFLSHTILHELAHLLNKWGQDKEDDCDKWAFTKL